MNWYSHLGVWEYVVISLFVLLYLLYAIKISIAARKLHTHANIILAKFVLRGAYFSLLIVALLGPSYGNAPKEVKAIGKDIYLVVDMSRSMDATDIAPSRLERIKYELTGFVEQMQQDRVGLIVFSSQAFMQCPLTFDKNTLKLFIETLKTSLLPSGSTDLEPALQMALGKHTSNVTSQNNAKIIVLISDGEHYGKNLSKILREIEQSGVRLFTLGIGTASGGKIPEGKGFKKDKDGQEIISRLTSEVLMNVVNQSADRYFVINDTQNEMNKLVNAVHTIEGRLIDRRKVDVLSNKFHYFLAAALVLICLDVLITVKTIQL